jgi:2-oxoglutarate ferredoxin oxidoreductase subunit alpha
MQARWGTHGDHPIIVLAPSSVRDSFEITVKAFNFSERYRTPVTILSDEVVAHTRETVILPESDEIEVVERIRPNMPPEWYIPYEETSSGVPPMGIFGDGYRYHVTGLIHDIRGFPTTRADEIESFMKRIHRKISQNFHDIQMVKHFMTEDAELIVVAYGSVARSARRAVVDARAKGLKAGLLHLVTLYPFPRRDLVTTIRDASVVLVPEMNMGQLSREVKRVNEGMTRVATLNRIDGRMITPQEIYERIIKES